MNQTEADLRRYVLDADKRWTDRFIPLGERDDDRLPDRIRPGD